MTSVSLRHGVSLERAANSLELSRRGLVGELLARSESRCERLGEGGRSSTGSPEPRALKMASRSDTRWVLLRPRLARFVVDGADCDVCWSSCAVMFRRGLCV